MHGVYVGFQFLTWILKETYNVSVYIVSFFIYEPLPQISDKMYSEIELKGDDKYILIY